MKKTIFFAAAAAALAVSQFASAQTNLQTFYDFGDGRGYVTTTLEGFYGDKWGDTFFFIDHYYSNANNMYGACNGSYFEIERNFNFWKDSAAKDLSFQVEYDGATWPSSTFCFGPKYAFHSDDWSKMFTIALLYDCMYGAEADTPLKVSGVWGLSNIFGVKGLTFKGFFDFWGNNCAWFHTSGIKETHWSFLSEPQLWYNLGEDVLGGKLDLGTEIEISNNFAGHEGFMVNPCLGARFTF